MLFFLLTLMGTALYLQIGFQVGRIGWSAWTLQRRSKAAFMLFPLSWQRNEVGASESVPPLQGVNPPQGAYRVAALVLWPFLLCWSAAIIAVLGPDLLVRRLTIKTRIAAQDDAVIEQQNRLLEEQSKELDQVIWELENEKQKEDAQTRVV